MEGVLPKRKPLRWRHYDYSRAGLYFITICTHNRRAMLSHIVGAIHESPAPLLTEKGKIVEDVIHRLPSHLSVQIDRYVIMPNHIHLLIEILRRDEERAIRESPLRDRSIISKTVGYLKMNVSKEIHMRYDDAPVWQRGFHDHVVRDREDYVRIARYICENPRRWQQDCFYIELCNAPKG